jgi:hypothetical protein
MHFIGLTLLDLFYLLLKVFLIVVPLMIILEVSREFKVLDRLTSLTYPMARRLGFKRDSIYPLLAGIIFGISYGGGVLIGESNSGRISSTQMLLIALFLGMCHAVFEDTLLFMSQGANGYIILFSRILLATAVVFIFSIFLREKSDQQAN